jgi:ATP-binding cassette subfamily F protein uup
VVAVLHGAELEKSYGDRIVLRDCSLTIERGERVGLVGVNGSGKSTLMKILAGVEEPDGGRVVRGASVAYLSQTPQLPGKTVGEAAREALSWHGALLASYQSAVESGELEQAAAAQARLDLVGWDLTHRVESMLERVCAPPLDADLERLSGGEVRRVALARVLLRMPEVLLLDEPTNHLDGPTIEWLEGYLKGFRGAVLMVTHDRYMLESVSNRIVEVEDGGTVSYQGSYTDYLVERAERRMRQQRTEDRRLAMIAREAAWAARSPAARTGKQKGRLKRLEALQGVRNLQRDREFSFSFSTGFKRGNTLVEMYAIEKGFGGLKLIDGLDLTIRPGDRLGILGPNGCGKSTLLNILAKRLQPDAGRIQFGPRVSPAVLDQSRSGLDEDDTVIETISPGGGHVKLGEEWVTVQGYLGRFLFDRTHLDQQVSELSGGEQARLLLAKLLLQNSPLLLLDEPTNDLDLMTLRVLEEALMDHDGGAVIVTHDRAFLDRVCTGVLACEPDGQWVMYASRTQQVAAARARSEPVRLRAAPIRSDPALPSKTRVSYQEKRELEALPAEIEGMEAEQEELSALLSDPATYRERGEEVSALNARLVELNQLIESGYERWADLEERG